MVTNKEVIERVPDEIDYDCFDRRHPDGHDAPNAASNAVTSNNISIISAHKGITMTQVPCYNHILSRITGRAK